MTKEVTIYIDGIEVRTTVGKTVLEAAIDAGIYIPYLCYHPGMKPFAACRMCVVDVEGGRGTPASCTLPVSEGMVVNNSSSQIYELRRGIMEMLLAEHPHGCLTCHRVDLCGPNDICLRHVSVNDRCVTCPKNERCELKDTVRYLGMDLESPLEYKYRGLQVETGDPFYDRDYNLCIVCGRCVRACEEIRGDNAITFIERAGQTLIGTSYGTSLLESGCEFCGACLDVCPVGALVESDHKWEKPTQVERSICPQCPVGCQMNLEINRFGKVIRVVPEVNSPVNKGQACFKGKFGLDFVNRKERLKKPLIRRNGDLEEASWEEAIGLIAQTFKQYQKNNFAFLTAGDGTNEDNYLAQKFTRVVMQTNNVDQTTNTKPELLDALGLSLGYRSGTNPIWDLEGSQVILAFSTNLTEEQNVIGVPIKKAVKSGSKLIVIDPREVELTRYADVWLRPKPGTENLVLAGIMKEIVRQGFERREWINDNCNGLEELRKKLESLDLQYLVEVTGVSSELIEKTARIYGPSDLASIVYGLDTIPKELRSECVYSLSGLSLLTGNLGRPSSGIYPMLRRANEQGAWDVGCVPHLLPGYIDVSDCEGRSLVSEEWGSAVPSEKGLGLVALLGSDSSQSVKSMYIVGDNGNSINDELDDPMKALDSLEFLVVQDMFMTPLAEKADVVLPRLAFSEKLGTYTNIERRIQMLRPVISPNNTQAKSEGWAISEIARAMGSHGFDFDSPDEIMQEMSRVMSIYGGVSYDRLEKEGRLIFTPDFSGPMPTQMLYSDKIYNGLHWPCTNDSTKDSPILYAEGFPRERYKIIASNFQHISILDSADYNFMFVPGRVLLQPDREVNVVRGKNNRIDRQEIIEIHYKDAEMLSIVEGDDVEVQLAGATVHGQAKFRDGIQRGIISSTFLFGQLMVELESNTDPDPMRQVKGLTVVPARLVKS